MTTEKNYEGFRVWKIDDNQIPKQIMSGTKAEFSSAMDKLKTESDWTDTYAIRIGKYGVK